MWIELQTPDENSKMTLPYIYMKTADGNLVPWLASQTDLLSTDWMEWTVTGDTLRTIFSDALDEVRNIPSDDVVDEYEPDNTDSDIASHQRDNSGESKGTVKEWARVFPVNFCKDCPYGDYLDQHTGLYWCRLHSEICEGVGVLRSGKCNIVNKFGVYRIEDKVCPDKKV